MLYWQVGLLTLIWTTVNGSKENQRPKPSDTDYILKEFPTIRNEDDKLYSTRNDIYCAGDLLHDASLLGLEYLNLKSKKPANFTKRRFKELKAEKGGHIAYSDMEHFINEYFENRSGLEVWTPPDFTDNPKILEKISDYDYKEWAYELNKIWKTMAYKVSSDVKHNPDRYSLIDVPNGFIVPGENMKELHYWDSYWIVKGLLLCDMHDTARGIIENLIHLLKKYGLIPAANRKCNVHGSQPPFLIKMVDIYYKKTKDEQFLQKVIADLSHEINNWINHRLTLVLCNGKEYIMASYNADCKKPRAEAYSHDYMIAQKFSTEEEKDEFYMNIKAATESGMDFTSRWFIKNKSNEGNITNIATTHIIPVDLNAILHHSAKLLSEWYYKLGNEQKGGLYKVFSDVLLQGINGVLWDEKEGMWFDYNNKDRIRRDYFYASNLVPLWTKSYPNDWSEDDLSDKVISYLDKFDLVDGYYGVPSSLTETGERWDFNVWPPMQSMIIDGLSALGNLEADKKAYELARKCISSMYKGYKKNRRMFSNYHPTEPGVPGIEEDYSTTTGYGWTNAVVLELLDKYGEILTSDD